MFPLPILNNWNPQHKGGEVYFGTQLQKIQSMVDWQQGRSSTGRGHCAQKLLNPGKPWGRGWNDEAGIRIPGNAPSDLPFCPPSKCECMRIRGNILDLENNKSAYGILDLLTTFHLTFHFQKLGSYWQWERASDTFVVEIRDTTFLGTVHLWSENQTEGGQRK